MDGRHAPALVADIGGTHARFALASDTTHGLLRESSIRIVEVAEFASLDAAAMHYLDGDAVQANGIDRHSISLAVLAVAGRVVNGQAHLTNHAWSIDTARLTESLQLARVELVNDFAAQAMAIGSLAPKDIHLLGGSKPIFDAGEADRTWAVIGPGTGLGVAALLRRDGHLHPLPTEGGHLPFAPQSEQEIRILEWLAARFGRVSIERLLSGPGLLNLHRARAAIGRFDIDIEHPETITERAQANDPQCVRTLELFCGIFGAIAGDLVLALGAWDGIYLSGGLTKHVLPWLAASPFRERFQHKGRFTSAMADVPVAVILHPQPGLLGAATIAAQLRNSH